MTKKAENDFLFEIGCEELPATNLADIFESAGENPLLTKLKKIFEEKRLSFGWAEVYATPRRIAFVVRDVADKQTAKDEKIKILVKDEAFSADGKPTEKLLSILKHRNASPSDLISDDLNGKTYVFLKKSEVVQTTEQLVPEICGLLVKTLSFPKNMRWDDSNIYFPRPIRNALCFYAGKPLQFQIGEIPVEPKTIIFRNAIRKSYDVKGVEHYFEILKKHDVILDSVERKKAVLEGLEALVNPIGGKIYEDAFLLNEVNFLVESPEAILSPFSKEFLTLPLEVLAVSMARKQRIFGITDKSGKLAPYIMAVLDGAVSEKAKKGISFNIENILKAKLQDSLFFYKEDTRIKLETKKDELKNLVFLKGAGSMLEKSERITRLVDFIESNLHAGADVDLNALRRACELSKADLLTQMVGEFPELQGVMGRYYAIQNGESETVALAIGEQYLPRTISDPLPQTQVGAYLSLLDKLDLIVSCFAIGLEPTSSMDPYGLRRSATAVLKIILDKEINISLHGLMKANLHELGSIIQKDRNEILKKLDLFFKDRFKALMQDRGVSESLADAVMATDFSKPYLTAVKLGKLKEITSDASFSQSAKVIERIANILKSVKEPLEGKVDSELFDNEHEKKVYAAFNHVSSGFAKAALGGDFRHATSLYAEAFFAILNEFFEKVFVNAPDPKVRNNRLILLKSVKELYTRDIADLSKVRLTQ